MTIKPLPSHWQPDLLSVIPDKPLTRSGEARTRYGRVVEEIVCGLLSLTDIPNSGTHEIVFDAHHKPTGTYCEIKSLRERNKLPLYEWRRTKDRECGVPLVYIIAAHRCTRQPTLRDVWHTMADTLSTLYILPSWWLDMEARKHDIRQLVKPKPGSRVGYERLGYCDGYRNVPFGSITAAAYHAPVQVESEVMGLPVKASALFHASLWPWML